MVASDVEKKVLRAFSLFAGISQRAVFFVAVLIVSSASFAVPVYSIQLYWCDDAEAELRRAQFSSLGSPVYVRSDPNTSGKSKILAGNFTCYAQAWCYKQRLSAQLPADAFIYQWESSTAPIEKNVFGCGPVHCTDLFTGAEKYDVSSASQSTTDTLEADLQKAGLDPLPAPDPALLTKAVTEMTRDELLAVGLNAADDTTGIMSLAHFLDRFSSDEAVGRAKLRLARRLLHRREFDVAGRLLSQAYQQGTPRERSIAHLYHAYGSYFSGKPSEACESFSSLASATTASVGIRRDALERAGVIAQSLGDYGKAWLTFEQLEECAATGPQAAEARLQLAGIAFELAGRQKGTWSEVKGLCNAVKEVAGARKQQHATSDLMLLEMRLNDSDTSLTLQAANEFLSTYEGVRREYFTALLYRATLLCRLKKFADAANDFRRILGERFSRDDKFAAARPRAEAACWMVSIYKQWNDEAKANEMLNLLRREFPNSSELREAEGVMAGS